MHEVVYRLTNEGIAVIIWPQQIVAIKPQPARRSRATGRAGIIEPLQDPAGGKELIRIGAGRHERARFGRSNVGIATDVVIRQWIMPKQGAVVAAEPVSPVVARPSLLREARRRFELASVGTHPEIASADVDFLAADSVDGASDQPVGAVNPVVESEAQTVDARLII